MFRSRTPPRPRWCWRTARRHNARPRSVSQPREVRMSATSTWLRRRSVQWLAAAAALIMTAVTPAIGADPIKIGLGMALTGPLAANGKMSLLAMQIWEDEVNAKGGLLGRPVKLVFYDDQSKPDQVPTIYSRRRSAKKWYLFPRAYAPTQAAAPMPLATEPKRMFFSLF